MSFTPPPNGVENAPKRKFPRAEALEVAREGIKKLLSS